MPKIRQALAVLVAAGCCIGFNTFRYPVVREMAAAISALGPSAAAKPGEKPAAAAKDPADGGSAEEPAPKPPANVVCKDGVCTFVSPDSPTASVPSAPPEDASADAFKEMAEKPPSSANPGSKAESISRPWGDFESKPTGSGDSASKGWGATSFSFEPAAEPQNTGTTTTAGERFETSGETKTAARLVSASLGGKSPPKEADHPPAAERSLIPIHRPKSRPKEPASSESQPASDAAKPEAEQKPSATPARRLPPVDPASNTDFTDSPTTLSPELVQTYAVTPAN